MLIGKDYKSEFAPPERLNRNAALAQYKEMQNDNKLKMFYDFTPDFVLVLNEYRQIIFANKAFLDFAGKKSIKDIVGIRPGELLNCEGAWSHTGGCGTSSFCGECGMVRSVLGVEFENVDVEECCIKSADCSTSHNFRVWSTRPWKDKSFGLFIVRDIADEKFRNALEQTFFHDLTNTASDIQSVISLIDSADTYKKYSSLLSNLSTELIEEINGQRDLRYAEEGTILIQKIPIDALRLLRNFINVYKDQKICKGINLILSDTAEEINFPSDERLLVRVLENMIKNAIEASKEGDTVSLSCFKENKYIVFSVKNPAYMPESVQLNLFKRSFSTKASGRGWGTYSIKLLTEKYLNGHIEFVSTPEDGTSFYARYPLL